MNLIVSYMSETQIEEYKNSGASTIVLADQRFALAAPHYSNESEQTLLVDAAHQQSLAVYALCNKMMFDEDLASLEQYLKFLKSVNIDGIYFSDMAVYMLGNSLGLTNKLIYAPKAPLTNSKDVSVYLDLGIKGVELADEITLDEKLRIAEKLPHRCSSMVHGHLLMSFSKRHLLSSYMAEINQSYEVKDKTNLTIVEATRDGKMPILENQHGTSVYQDKVLSSFDYIQQLITSGMIDFRIDGLFLAKEHVLAATQVYRDISENNLTTKQAFLALYQDILTSGYYNLETNLVK